MLTLGAGEIAVIMILALVLFGPKKLPELGRTIGKAMTEFNRARNDLKATFEREMRSLEQENFSIQKIAHDTMKELTDHATELADHASYNYGLPAAEEVWNPLDYEAHGTENPTQQPAIAAADDHVAEAYLEHAAESTGVESHNVESAANTVLEAAAEVPTIITPAEGTVSRANGKATIALQAARETRELAEQAANDVPTETPQHNS